MKPAGLRPAMPGRRPYRLLPVLRDAGRIIDRDRPILLVEAESRHNPDSTGAVFRFFRRGGYAGFVLRRGGLQPISAPWRDRNQQLHERLSGCAGGGAIEGGSLRQRLGA